MRVCAQRSSATKTQGNLVCPGFSKPRTDDDAFARIVHGIYEVLLRTHQTPEQTPSQSAFLRCPHNCIFEDSAEHNGPARVRNTNLSGLASETMWSQPIFIELLAVLLLLQEHMHFLSPTSRHFPLTTYLKSSCIHSHFTTRNGHENFKKVLRVGCT